MSKDGVNPYRDPLEERAEEICRIIWTRSNDPDDKDIAEKDVALVAKALHEARKSGKEIDLSNIPNHPAFPRDGDNCDDQEGMSLRDFFAGKAMQGIVSYNGSYAAHPPQIAEYAYKIANAMLAERVKP